MTGVVIDVTQFDQYVVNTYGPGRMTLRNGKFTRLYAPVVVDKSRSSLSADDLKYNL